MTLILSVTSPSAAYQVSDRRVTRIGGNGWSNVHSGVENKSLIFLCKDAVGTIGYTGLAYMDAMPTDQWLANLLAPQPPGAPELGSFGYGGRGLGGARLQTIIWKLRNAIKSSHLPDKAARFQVALAGFRIRRHRCIPFQVEISRCKREVILSGSMRLPRSPDRHTAISQIGDTFPAGELIDHLKPSATDARSKEQWSLRKGLIHAVRMRSKQSRLVGADLMTIEVPHPHRSREIIWTFEPATRHDAQIVGGQEAIKFEAVYSPWVLTPRAVACPSIGTAGLDVHCGGWAVKCGNQAAPVLVRPGQRLVFASSSQRRTTPP